jgi:hypothetical protein
MDDYTIADMEKFNAAAELYNARFGTEETSATLAEFFAMCDREQLDFATAESLAIDLAGFEGREWK